MSNVKRHALGIPAGLIVGPVSLGLLAYGVYVHATLGTAGGAGAGSPVGMTCLVMGGLLTGMLAAARWASPLAALIAGAIYAVLGVALLPPLSTDLASRGVFGTVAERVGETPWQALLTFGRSGMLLAVGVLLLITALLPNRWRGRPKPQPAPEAASEVAPQGVLADSDAIVGTGISITPDPDRAPLPRRPAPDDEDTKTALKSPATPQ